MKWAWLALRRSENTDKHSTLFDMVVERLKKDNPSCIIYTSTKKSAEKLCSNLQDKGDAKFLEFSPFLE